MKERDKIENALKLFERYLMAVLVYTTKDFTDARLTALESSRKDFVDFIEKIQ